MSARIYASYAAAIAAEVIPRFAPFAYTPADVERMALLMLTPLDTGGYSCDFAGSLSDFRELFASTVPTDPQPPEPCSLPWCSGRSAAHDGTGRYNSHYSAKDDFAPRNIFFGCIEQVGDAPPFYRLVPQEPPSKVLLTATEVRALADDFERHAVTLRERAAQLEQFGGIR